MRILVTGGSRGIGSAIVDIFRKNNHDVYSPDRNSLDLSDDFKLLKNDFDVVINNAGINPLKSIIDIDSLDVLQVNYLSPLKILQQCLPFMVQQKYGRIINIGSIWIEFAKEKRLAYAASKSALHSMTKALSVEYAKYNILSNTVSPGFIATELTYQNNTEQDLDIIKSNIPVNRLGTPQEIADIVYFLAINNSFITGQNIIADGGFSSCVI